MYSDLTTQFEDPTDAIPMGHAQLFTILKGQSTVKDLGLYVHIPFCLKRCHFCAFYLLVHREDLVCAFLGALEQEMVLFGRELGNIPVTTVYLGGGTPTSLKANQLVGILDVVRKNFQLVPQAEITIEASPDTLTKHGLQEFKKAGINRVSMGVQTFDRTVWEHLGRSGHTLATKTAVELARHVGFQNVNLDLMYGLPEQTLGSWQESLQEVIALTPTHVSCYALTLEEGTRFFAEYQRGENGVGDPDEENAMYQRSLSTLTSAGYRQYEVSNYGLPGFECRHNVRYWKGKDYVGFGPSAQSHIGMARFGNVENLSEYCRKLHQHDLPLSSIEVMSKQQADREQVVFGLRLVDGVDLRDVEPLHADNHWRVVLDQLEEEGLLHHEGKTLRLTEYGRRFADSVAVQLL